MIELAIDTSGTFCAAAIYDGREGKLLSQITNPMERGHAEHLMQIIADVLVAADKQYSDIERVVSTVGPGSFTGIRVGLATARGIGLGLGVDVVGVTTLEAIYQAFAADSGDTVMVALDAKRGEACYQLFDKEGQEITPPAIGNYEDVAAVARLQAARILGSAIPQLQEILGDTFNYMATVQTPPIAMVAEIGAKKTASDARPEPLYLRNADAKPQSGFAVERE